MIKKIMIGYIQSDASWRSAEWFNEDVWLLHGKVLHTTFCKLSWQLGKI